MPSLYVVIRLPAYARQTQIGTVSWTPLILPACVGVGLPVVGRFKHPV